MVKNTLYLAENLLNEYRNIYQSSLTNDQIISKGNEILIQLRDAYKSYKFLFNEKMIEEINYLKKKYLLLEKYKELHKYRDSKDYRIELNNLINELLNSKLYSPNDQKLSLIRNQISLINHKRNPIEKKKKKVRELTSEEIAEAIKHSFGHDEEKSQKQKGNWTPEISGDSWRDD